MVGIVDEPVLDQRNKGVSDIKAILDIIKTADDLGIGAHAHALVI